MRLAALIAAGGACALLSACGSLPGTGGQNFDLNKFLTDPACAHDDEIQGVTGAAGIPASLQFHAARHCPAAGAPAAAPQPVSAGSALTPALTPPGR